MGGDRRTPPSGFSSSQDASQKDLVEEMRMLSVTPSRPSSASVIPPPESGRCPVNIIADETLAEIFELVMKAVRTPPRNEETNFHPWGRRVVNPWPTIQPFVLSQVCKQWRMASHNTSTLWTTLRIWHTNHSETWRTFISRSGKRRLDVEIHLPNHQSIELWDRPRIFDFKRIFKSVRGCSHRIRTLSIHAPNTTTRIIINDVFEKIHFTSLEELKVSQAGQQQPLCFFGPMSFNQAVFRSLTLFGVMVDCYATCLEGVEDLHLVGSSGALLDQEKLTHLTYPAIPPGPTMTRLKTLMLTGTYPIPDFHQPGSVTPIPIRPSFSIDHLSFLHLSQFRDIQGTISPSLTCLFKMVCQAPVLECLRLEAFDDAAFQIFVDEVEGCTIRPQYPRLRWLHLIFIPTAVIREDSRFLEAFPELSQLRLMDSDGTPISANLIRNPTLCPKLPGMIVDMKYYNREMIPVTF